nr:type II secretion system F family protein [Lachnospiraceae bacterium]
MDYSTYRMSVKETIKYSLSFLLIFMLLAKVFYDFYPAGLVGVVFLPFLLRAKGKTLAAARRERLAQEFKQFILAFSASLKAGYSVENAFAEASGDLYLICGEGADMVVECRHICHQLQNNRVLEELMADFAERSGHGDIRDFAAIFSIAKRSGGNMNTIVQNTAAMIGEKIEVKREIALMLAARRAEQKVMNVVPIGIIGYMRWSSPGYFDGLYKTPFGILVMSICLFLYLCSYIFSRKIMNIEV